MLANICPVCGIVIHHRCLIPPAYLNNALAHLEIRYVSLWGEYLTVITVWRCRVRKRLENTNWMGVLLDVK